MKIQNKNKTYLQKANSALSTSVSLPVWEQLYLGADSNISNLKKFLVNLFYVDIRNFKLKVDSFHLQRIFSTRGCGQEGKQAEVKIIKLSDSKDYEALK